MDVHDPNALQEIESVIELCQFALAHPNADLNRGGVVTKLLSGAKAKQAAVKPIVRGRQLDRLPPEILAFVFEFATEDDLRN